ncbi:type VI secretion protein VasK [Rhodoferax koreense]|uniref:Type VI secretion protein VasK n=2 Tax=Rhodoferax koreensis TaxID=1842727 RepID=A0A1P8K400_9BURK|nr:type VI secretion protein VasK [Rhodoferax koreense]
MLTLGILWLVNGPYSLVGVAALCLLVWHAGPLLSLGNARPLATPGARTLVVAAILFVYLLYGLFLLRRALRDDKEFLGKVLNFGNTTPEDNAAKEELKTVASTVSRAMAQLRKLRGHGGLRRFFEGRRYLYELPWYMIVGSPGAGKTTALLNSGLQFPVVNQAGHSPRSVLLHAQGGTMNCDWWFTNEAVLIDTAGRYTQHDTGGVKDTAEWTGFLALMRKHRPRAPLNGVIVALNVADLLGMDEIGRSEHAAMVRERLAELRQELGIRFPVYVIVTKLDLLGGFEEYFQSLTSEARLQVWGFTLPHVDGGRRSAGKRAAAQSREALREQITTELGLLKDRLAAGLRLHLNEEFDVDRRRRLFALPQEFAGLSLPLAQVVDEIFLDSRFDDTQWHTSLRGVYLTSGAQTARTLPAEPATLLQRMRRSLGWGKDIPVAAAAATVSQVPTGLQDAPLAGPPSNALPQLAPVAARQRSVVDANGRTGHQSFFLQDLMTKVIFPEAHLVRPNLRWEFRFRLLGLLGHTLAVVLFVWLAGALWLSFGNNRQYLDVVDGRARALDARVRSLFADFKPAGVPDTLNEAYQLPGYAGLDLQDPPGSFRFGLYSAAPVLEASTETYAHLQDHMLLPTILRRMETVLAQSLKNNDATTAYETLRVYKLLHDRAHYMQTGGAADVRNWVLKDWENTDSAAAFGGRASMVGHVQALFSGTRAVQSASLPNEALVRDVQRFLDSNTSTQRIYERAKAAMLNEAPQEFTLVRAVGPQAGTVFSRAGKLPLEKGVPGLFTYDGYHEVFNKRLPEFVGRALADDAWVMGRGAADSTLAGGAKSALAGGTGGTGGQGSDALLDDIRRQYLTEYAQQWDDFLNSIRTVAGSDTTGSSLGFDLSVLRQFAAPDSPLARLARAAARETTLSRPLVTRAPEDKSLLDKAADQLAKQTKDIGRNLGIRQEERLEKQLVDNRFAALREVVTGQPDVAFGAGQRAAVDANGAKPGLEGISSLVNEFYTLLVVADTALTANSLPPAGAEVGSRLKLEAGKLPAPFREVLTALATSGGDKVLQGSTDIIRKQAQVQLDRLMGLMAMQVSEVCKRGVEGRYPFAAVPQDASIEDVTQVFATGGVADEYFNKYLAPFVDTSVRPWRYKSSTVAGAMVGLESLAAGASAAVTPAPAGNGPTLVGELLKLLAQSGPNLDAFYRAQQIRELFFREAGGKKMAWKLDVKVVELDPTITDLVIDIDGQGQRYMHGPVQSFTVNWPGTRGGAMAEIVANPRLSNAASTLQASGPWALFRLLDKGRIVSTATSGRVGVEYSFDGRKALLDISGGSQPNPLNSDVLRGFHCPGTAA